MQSAVKQLMEATVDTAAAPGRDAGVAAAVSTVASISCLTADCILATVRHSASVSDFIDLFAYLKRI